MGSKDILHSGGLNSLAPLPSLTLPQTCSPSGETSWLSHGLQSRYAPTSLYCPMCSRSQSRSGAGCATIPCTTFGCPAFPEDESGTSRKVSGNGCSTLVRAVAILGCIPLSCWHSRQVRGKWSCSAYDGLMWTCSAKRLPSTKLKTVNGVCCHSQGMPGTFSSTMHYTDVPIRNCSCRARGSYRP